MAETPQIKAAMPFIVPNDSVEAFLQGIADEWVFPHPAFPGMYLWIHTAYERLKLKNHTIFTILVKDFRKDPNTDELCSMILQKGH